ncbi:MAG: amidohydrolase family protein, partial [Clostridiales bacterium]
YYLPVHIHLAETLNENRQIEEAYGCRPLAYLQKAGLLDGIKLLAAHGVWLNQDEIELLAEVDASVAHNPCSNMKLASGIAPVGDMLAAKLNVSLGTDSACSNNNLDMFQEMRTAAYLGKIKNLDPKALPAGEILSMATVNGAEALGLYDVGTLSVGKKADLILLNTDTPHFTPVFDWVSHLVYAASGSDVDSVIVDGRLVVEKRKALYLDEEKIIYEAENAAQRLLSAL